MGNDAQTPADGVLNEETAVSRAAAEAGSPLAGMDLRALVPSRPEQADQLAQLLDAYGLFCEANRQHGPGLSHEPRPVFPVVEGSPPAPRLAPPLLHHYKKWLIAAKDTAGEVLSARTINNDLAAVRAFCAWLLRHERRSRGTRTPRSPTSGSTTRRMSAGRSRRPKSSR